MAYSVKRLLKIYEEIIQILLILYALFVEDSHIEYLLCDAPSCPETSLLFFNDLFPFVAEECLV